ncbi:hypothetical protein EEB18_012665 [Sphingopyxis sp. OPL5]|uniref:hypothetical protein n=1 Tax=Sphingopyxis sp. OPL5 TaxID=2486273 RepID=UPI00164E2C8B|nr:hypothetical protein [Sphingopyxis sp. OPL5]QNO25649.1 hypothetical protein EEB18_012665 [Sphingopyxis sp. OPL5]
MSQRFEIWVQDDPQALLRVVGLFAQRSLIPETMTVRRADDTLHVALVAELDAARADILVARLREGVMVIAASRHDAGAALDGAPPARMDSGTGMPSPARGYDRASASEPQQIACPPHQIRL